MPPVPTAVGASIIRVRLYLPGRPDPFDTISVSVAPGSLSWFYHKIDTSLPPPLPFNPGGGPAIQGPAGLGLFDAYGPQGAVAGFQVSRASIGAEGRFVRYDGAIFTWKVANILAGTGRPPQATPADRSPEAIAELVGRPG